MNVQLLSVIGSTWRGVPDGRRVSGDAGLRVFGIGIPGIPFADSSVDKDFEKFHYSTERLGGKFRDGFVVSVDGRILKTREFDVRWDGGQVEVSCAEGSFKARTFGLKADEDDLRTIHPGLVATPSVVLHHFGVDPGYEMWRSRLGARIPAPRSKNGAGLRITGGRIVATERNSPPLFGLSLIDALPDEVLVATAAQEPPEVRGRVNRMKSGRIGKFGWKAQTTNLREFVLGACASELGLEAPGHRQAISPLAPEVKAKGLDLTLEECDALIAYVQTLPAPVRLDSPHPQAIEAGRKLFESIGCTDCHRPNLGNIEGIYSDLLLHDMGPDLFSVTMSGYYIPPHEVDFQTASSMADGSEWRTPPLWGYRDSGPYLHDGRASDLVAAVRFHKGQASGSAARFYHLSATGQAEIEQFLNALAAPPEAAPVPEAARKDHPGGRRSMLGPSSSPSSRKPTTLARTDARARSGQERLATSRLKMAQNLEKIDNPQGALIFYREIVRDEPDSTAAAIAAARIKALTGGDGGR